MSDQSNVGVQQPYQAIGSLDGVASVDTYRQSAEITVFELKTDGDCGLDDPVYIEAARNPPVALLVDRDALIEVLLGE